MAVVKLIPVAVAVPEVRVKMNPVFSSAKLRYLVALFPSMAAAGGSPAGQLLTPPAVAAVPMVKMLAA